VISVILVFQWNLCILIIDWIFLLNNIFDNVLAKLSQITYANGLPEGTTHM
jgi:hypothetical protein